MPRAALLSIHARVRDARPSSWESPSVAQLWGPRYSVYVVAERDWAIFSLGRYPDGAEKRARAEELASRLHAALGGRRADDGGRRAARALGVHPNMFRYAATTGTVRIRWDGARAATIWTVPRPEVEPEAARRELARRYLHVFGPSTHQGFAAWAGVSNPGAKRTFEALAPSLVPVRTPLGDEWILASDEEALRARPERSTAVRLLPSGDAYWLLQGAARELLVPDPRSCAALWTPRVWPGALLVKGELAGTWRRAQTTLTVEPWRPMTRPEKDAVESEAASFPLPGISKPVTVRWEEPL